MSAELAIILLLLVANGVFAMSEIAVVTARRVRLQQRADAGDKGARAALRIASNPTEFLSTVQVGITTIGIFAGAYGGATLAEQLAASIRQVPLIAPYAEAVALAIVVGTITYLSLVIGELVPKAVALHNPERIAALVAGPVASVAKVAKPLVKILSWSTNLVLWVMRIRPSAERNVTEEDIRALIKQATVSGDVAPREQEIVEQVFRLGDRRVSAIMTPRHDIEWLDVHEGVEGIRRHLAEVKHPKILFCDGSLDTVLGVARTEQLLALVLSAQAFDVRSVLQTPQFVPATLSVFQLIDRFRHSPVHFALVLDEFGAIEGLVTPTDVLESLVGEIPSEPDAAAGPITTREDGSWLVDGAMPFEDLVAELSLTPLPDEEEGAYQTLAGFVMTRLARVPRAGDRFAWGDLRFEVVDMDGRRVDKVLIERVPTATPSGA
jgi:putative hemolysin